MLHPPSVRDFYAFEQHVKTARALRGLEVPPEWYEQPVFYFSNPAAIYGPDDEIPYPRRTRRSSTTSSRSRPSSAPRGRSRGFTVMNDWSARDLQRGEMRVGLGPAKGKDFATSIGPIVVTADEFPADEAEMVARVNGEERSRGDLRDLHFSWERDREQAARNTQPAPGRPARLRHRRHGLHPRARRRPLAAARRRRRARGRGHRRAPQHGRLTLPLGEAPSLHAMENLIPIGQFAAASRLSLKALRLYDENGLLPPAVVDPDSGYRFYRFEQLRSATLIGLLRGAGHAARRDPALPRRPDSARLDEYEAALADELAERRGVLDFVRRYIEEEQMFEVQVKQVPEVPYVSRSKRVRVAELEPFIVATIRELARGERGGRTRVHALPRRSERGGRRAGRGLRPGRRGERRLPAAEVAYAVAVGGQCRFPEIIGAYDAVAGWAKQRGRELDGPPREIYLFDPTQARSRGWRSPGRSARNDRHEVRCTGLPASSSRRQTGAPS